ncbi:HD domain-containing protein [Ruminiclostridium herbifermentans]|uniref:HD domain-containing protein n=1 Tax=Ruminiclostridium herbifermentans TaxID=2488810 RepID=A0A4U7JJ56_9FIRM|nr:HD domain-containing protein [Ruminiclostridium herbifermentans]QNU68526.1 HD domain-containing protein [Ruminiclostridium herbifermentans]
MIAESIFYDYIGKLKLDQEKEYELIEHTKRVVNLCNKFEEKLCLDEQLLHKAAWLHDIAKYNECGNKRYNHHIEASSVLSKYGFSYEDPVCNIIKAHTGDYFEPDEEYSLEAAVLRICDKLDKFNKGKKDAKDKCEASLSLIEDYFSEINIDIPNAFYKKYYKLFKKLHKKCKNNKNYKKLKKLIKELTK